MERDVELAALERTLAEARSGAGSVVVIEGPAGIGKTELLDCARAAAADGGFAIAFARCGALERCFVFGVARQLFEGRARGLSVGEDDRTLAGPAALAIPALGLEPLAAGDEGVDPAFSAVHGLLWLCMAWQEDRPLLIAVDDAQWCDDLSARFLAYLAARVDGTRIAVVLTSRTAPESDLPAGVAELLADRRTVALRPSPLSEAGSQRVLSDALGETPDAALAAECHRATGGSPFLLRALAHALAHEGAPGGVASVAGLVPSSVARAVVMRLNGVSDEAARLARAAAALDAEAPLVQVAQVAELDPTLAASAVDELVRAEVLAPERSVRFLHPLIGDAVRAEVPPGEAARLQTRAAAVLHAHGASPGRVGAHLLASGVVAEQWAVELLNRAAHEALEQGAPETAADLWRRALEERNALAAGSAGDDQTRVELLLGLGRAEVRAHRREGLEDLRAALALCPPGSPLRATAARELGRGLIHFGNAREAVALLDAALLESGDDSDALVELESELLTALRMDASLATELPERMPRTVARSERGDAAARLLLAQRAISAAWAAGPDTAEPATAVRELARRALADGALLRERGPEAPEIVLAAIALVLADAPDDAVAALDDAAEKARRRGSAVGYATALCWRGFAHHHRGDVEAAAADAEVCLEAEGAQGWQLLPAALATLVHAHVRQGDLDAAERTLATAQLDRNPQDGGTAVMLYGARAELLAARHQPEAAVADLLAVRRRFEPWGATSPALVPTRSRAARLLAALERTEEAESLATEELRLARTSGSPRAVGLALQGLAAAEPLDARIATLGQATTHLRESADRYAEADALCDLGAALRRARRPSEAREPLRRSLDLAHRGGAALLASRAREELVATGARPRRNAASGRDALTPAERRVANLAADGLGNREIAQTLFLSPKTVEVYLTRSYRKLGIRTRRELPDALTATPG